MRRAWTIALGIGPIGVAAGDDLADFSNNLAQDLGPLLALFGESVTRQYLSESTTILDYLIFALCPLGIITAIVSAIRVCGHPSLRAFIGRSQEGNGVVEAELCTSTSRDVSELFNQGAITRVLGRANVLELVSVENNAGSATRRNVMLFQDYLEKAHEGREEWKQMDGLFRTHIKRDDVRPSFAPRPNLSLNVGIKRQPLWVFTLVAVAGLVFQAGVIVLAGIGSWKLGWNVSDSSDSSSKDYAPRMFISGTLLLCLGMFSCAATVGQATSEVTYRRRKSMPSTTRLVWLQPGQQVVGDQSFDPYVHIEDPSKPIDYWTSSRKLPTGVAFQALAFLAALVTLVGYVLQFIGLRGMKAWVSIAQLGVTLLMAFLRSLLRMQRLGPKDNGFAHLPDLYDFYSNLASRPLNGFGTTATVVFINTRILEQEESSLRWVPMPHALASEGLQIISAELDDDTLDVGDTQQDLNLWLEPSALGFLQVKLIVSEDDTCGYTDLWWMERPFSGTFRKHREREARAPNYVRFFGWHVVYESLGLKPWEPMRCARTRKKGSGQSVGTDPVTIRIQCAPEWNRSLLSLCSANLYTCLVRSLATLGEMARSTIIEHHGMIQMQNPDVSTMVKAFVDNGLGTDTEAMMSIVPALRDRIRPRREDIYASILEGADMHRKAGEWDRSQALLRWACHEYTQTRGQDREMSTEDSGTAFTRILQKTGELYRWSLAGNPSSKRREFGLGGIKWMVESYGSASSLNWIDSSKMQGDGGHERAEAYGREIVEIVDRYKSLAEAIETTRKPAPPPRGEEHPLLRAIKNRDRIEALHQLCYIETGQFGSTTLRPVLPLAVRNGWNEVVDAILELKGNIDSQDEDGRTAVSHCAELGDETTLKDFLKLGAFGDLADTRERTPLHWAASSGQSGAVRLLIQTGQVDSGRPNKEGDTALWCALRKNHLSVVEALTDAGVSVEQPCKNNETPLLWAAQEGRAEVIGALLKAGANVCRADKDLQSPLYSAAARGHTDAVKALIENNAKLDQVCDLGRTPLLKAAEGGHSQVVKVLLDAGADVRHLDSAGWCSLSRAAERGCVPAIVDLLNHGAELDRVGVQDKTPLAYAVIRHGYKDAAALLLEKGANANRVDIAGQSWLFWAATKGYEGIVQLLLDNGAEVDRQSNIGATPLFAAAESGHDAIVRLLIASGANVDHQVSKYRQTSLTRAAERGNVRVVEELLRGGAAVDLTDSWDQTPLVHACEKGHEKIVQVLVDNGADINHVDRFGRTPSSSAAQNYKGAIVKYLAGKGAI
ncbi:ankyrin repeat domain-containing protein 28 [Purpureocillium lavendulum]|uniref:Ankyrin repeat domain-containing protein 28 n=1 Tax=Purpureocillium lavendulum TaxID=1247861 RepID=A0AB34FFZ6_9HYPO|nr:ankyrin repeat domain-containing protein 28 [Purpureocillium lavendulum]